MYKILIADDEPDIRQTLQKRLEKEGYGVLSAEDGEKALDLALSDESPDIIVLDIMMPKKNGFEVLKSLRSTAQIKWQPVIILSSNDEFSEIKKGYNLEADFYVTKPFSMSQLLRGIETMITLLEVNRSKK